MDEQVLLDNLRTDMPLFNSGREVAYFLITARKIIDNEKLALNYSTLYVYCNWIVHCKLDKKSNITIVEDTQNKNVNKKFECARINIDYCVG